MGHLPASDPIRDCTKQLISSYSATGKNIIHVPDDWSGGLYHGRVLSEYCQLFWLARALESRVDLPDFLEISQYRKFVSPMVGRIRPANTPYVFAISDSESPEYLMTLQQIRGLTEISNCELVGPVLKVGSTVQNYSQFHVLEDLLNFCASIARRGLFDAQRTAKFINYPFLIPGPSLGLHKTEHFLRDMGILKLAWASFYAENNVQRDGYQRRVGGFLLERLHSFLVMSRKLKKECVVHTGNQFVVTENSSFIRPTI